MNWLLALVGWLQAGPLKGYRLQVVGITTALVAIINDLSGWAVGDMTFTAALKDLGANWQVLVTGLSLWFGGDKLNAMAGMPTITALSGWFHPTPVVVAKPSPDAAATASDTAVRKAAVRK